MIKFFSSILGFSLFGAGAADASQQVGRQGSMAQTAVMVLIALVFFYFILWRPEQKRRRTMDKLRSTLKPGDRATAMGIIGTVVSVADQTVVLRMIDGSSEIEILKGAITEVKENAAVIDPSKPTVL